MHRNGPVRLNHSLPYLWQNNLAIGPNEVVVAVVDMLANDINVKESLLDKLFHSLVGRQHVALPVNRCQ